MSVHHWHERSASLSCAVSYPADICCNSMLFGINQSLLDKLESILCTAACLILQKRKFDSISTDIRDRLHWLPICQRIEFKICVLVYRCLYGTALHYITLHYRHFKCYLHLKWPVVHQQLHVIWNTAHRPSMQASYTASRVRPKGKISCAAAQIAAALTISFPRGRHMSLTSYWGQQRMSLTSYPGQRRNVDSGCWYSGSFEISISCTGNFCSTDDRGSALPSYSRNWNSTFVMFKKQLKMILFARAYWCHMRTAPP